MQPRIKQTASCCVLMQSARCNADKGGLLEKAGGERGEGCVPCEKVCSNVGQRVIAVI